MQKTAIKQGKWYETELGTGECLKAGGCFPWAALVDIPLRGHRWLTPREFVREVPAPAPTLTQLAALQAPWPVERPAGQSQDETVEGLIHAGLMYREHISHGWVRIGLTNAGRARVDAAARAPAAEVLASAAAEVTDSPTNEALRVARHGWHNMYLGAFCALTIMHVDMAKELAEMTCSDEEAIRIIGILRVSKEGDRVWPAREWIKAQRRPAP